jgi:hypothetical protein
MTTQELTVILKEKIKEETFVDVGPGIEKTLGASRTKLYAAISDLEEEGYRRYYLNVDDGSESPIKLRKYVGPPDKTIKELLAWRSKDIHGKINSELRLEISIDQLHNLSVAQSEEWIKIKLKGADFNLDKEIISHTDLLSNKIIYAQKR